MSMLNQTELKIEFGKLVALRRKALGLSQEDLAEKAHIQIRTISKIENGHSFVTAETLCKLCEAFNMSPESFFDFRADETVKERKTKEIIDKIKNCDNKKIDFYYGLFNLVDKTQIFE